MASSSQTPTIPGSDQKRIKVVVATSVMLSFISFWRAAAIVLNDLGSSAFYAGGIAEQAVGPAAPWFILGVMLFSYAVRAVYVESCAMFTRGGVYRVVKEAMGGTLAKVSVSALMFDYILTGPISGVSAGQYIVGLAAQTLTYFGHPWHPDKETINHIAAGIAVLITLYFWRRNIRGIHESSDDALKIMYIVTAMIVVMVGWSAATLVAKPETRRLPPAPVARHLSFNEDAAGWMPKLLPQMFEPERKEMGAPTSGEAVIQAAPAETRYVLPEKAGLILGLIGILIAFGHSFLAMSGEESLAQVNRELEFPKHENLMKAGMVIFLYSLAFTSLVSFFAYALIPDEVRPHYYDNMISGISMYLVGPTPVKLLFQGFIVMVGFLMLAGAVNTAIIGSNGVLNRVSEDGVLTDWFRSPHRKYGTTHRMIDLIVLLQLLTIIGSRGEVYTLGEAYAFGVIWSFAFKGLAMVVLRFRNRSHREWKVPFNIHWGDLEIPIGISVIALILFSVAGINLITKQVATVSGVAFTLVFYLLFWASEYYNHRKRGAEPHVEMDQFKIIPKDEISHDDRYIRPGNVLCLVRDYNTLEHVKFAIEQVDTEKKDLVILTVRKLSGPDTGYENLSEQDLFTSYEQLLFSRVVALAEKAGKHVELMVIPSSQVFQAIVMAAVQLRSSEIIAGKSSVMEASMQALQLGQAWELLPKKPEYPVSFKVIEGAGQARTFYLGAHAPELGAAEIAMIHQLWLEITKNPGHETVHHGDVVSFALSNLRKELDGPEKERILRDLDRLRGRG